MRFVCRLDAPFGTEDKPVEVTSSFSERIVGVPDPYDDSIVWWGNIHEGDPPKQVTFLVVLQHNREKPYGIIRLAANILSYTTLCLDLVSVTCKNSGLCRRLCLHVWWFINSLCSLRARQDMCMCMIVYPPSMLRKSDFHSVW